LSIAEYAEYFNIGAMYPLATKDMEESKGVQYIEAIMMAVDEINDKTDGIYDDVLPHTELRVVARAPLRTFSLGASNALELLTVDKGVLAVIGPAGLHALEGSSPILEDAGHIPQICYLERDSLFGDSKHFPNLLRTIPAEYLDGRVVGDLIVDLFHWDKVTLFSTSDAYGSQTSFVFKQEAKKKGVDILSVHQFLRYCIESMESCMES
jgi:ABC-type branched-subunit amino acid transport system substrate-binding protein